MDFGKKIWLLYRVTPVVCNKLVDSIVVLLIALLGQYEIR